jgi:hypothetical protein
MSSAAAKAAMHYMPDLHTRVEYACAHPDYVRTCLAFVVGAS